MLNLASLKEGWTSKNDVSVKGFIFFREKLLSENDFCDFILSCDTREEFFESVNLFRGSFSIVDRRKQIGLALVDIVRSYPIFYTKNEISDNLKDLDFNRSDVSNLQIDYFKAIGSSHDNKTIYNELFQIPSGGVLDLSTKEIITYHYFKDDYSPQKEFSEVIKTTFDRIEKYASERKIIIPLSGGLDSRFILAELIKRGLRKNIFCYTYGAPDSFELKQAEQVTKQLNVEWAPIHYTNDVLNRFYNSSLKEYFSKTNKGVFTPYEQDFIAQQILLKDGKIKKNDVVVPGFGADVLAGSWLTNKKATNFSEFLNKYTKIFQIQPSQLLQQHLNHLNIEPSYNEEFIDWSFKNRIAGHQLRFQTGCEYLGLKCYYPFLDRDYIQFWMGIEKSLLTEKTFYKEYLTNEYFSPLGINEFHGSVDDNKVFNLIKSTLNKAIPNSIKQQLKKKFFKQGEQDPNNSTYLTQLISKELNLPLGLSQNAILSHYTLYLNGIS